MTQPGIQNLINKYRASPLKKRDILREILQQSALMGLARHQFFEHAAFYGGTALRILYGLDRFSEDLDFSLLKPNAQFNFQPFLEGLQREMDSFGFHVEVKAKKKEPTILSAFVKSNTLKLTSRMRQSNHLPSKEELDHKKLLGLLGEKIGNIDWEHAKNDVRVFLNDPKVLDVWSQPFFLELISNLKSL